MAVVRLEALKALRQRILDEVPSLMAEHVRVEPATPDEKLCFPSLLIQPLGFKYIPDQDDEVYDPAGEDRIVVNVGRFEARVQLRLAAATLDDRYRLEDELTNAFLRTEGHPGVLLTVVTACPDLGDFLAAWEFEETEWRDEKAFDTQWWAVTELMGTIPALVTREGVGTIEDLRLGLSHDFETEFTSETFDTSPKVEVVKIAEDGTITPV